MQYACPFKEVPVYSAINVPYMLGDGSVDRVREVRKLNHIEHAFLFSVLLTLHRKSFIAGKQKSSRPMVVRRDEAGMVDEQTIWCCAVYGFAIEEFL